MEEQVIMIKMLQSIIGLVSIKMLMAILLPAVLVLIVDHMAIVIQAVQELSVYVSMVILKIVTVNAREKLIIVHLIHVIKIQLFVLVV